MRNCAWCDKLCTSAIGCYRELKTEYWGGAKGRHVEYSPKLITFFCSETCRTQFLVSGRLGGEIQERKFVIDED